MTRKKSQISMKMMKMRRRFNMNKTMKKSLLRKGKAIRVKNQEKIKIIKRGRSNTQG